MGLDDKLLGGKQRLLTGGQEEYVLDERREHVAEIQVEERTAEVHSVGGDQQDGCFPKSSVGKIGRLIINKRSYPGKFIVPAR